MRFPNRLSIALILLAVASQVAHANSQRDGFIETFDGPLSSEDWYVSDFEMAANWMATRWSRDMLEVLQSAQGTGEVRLSIKPNGVDETKPFLGAELQRTGKFHFGDFEVYMQAGRGRGMLSSFFTYTGPHFNDPHDEIDFEILGHDTTKVELNKYVNGEKIPQRVVDLGFDAANSLNLYRFEWRSDRITWIVNGQQVFEVSATDTDIPQNPQKIFMNIWVGGEGQYGWMKKPNPDLETTAIYSCVSYRPIDGASQTCSEYVETLDYN